MNEPADVGQRPGELDVSLLGHPYTLRMPIGAFEDIARHEPKLQMLARRLGDGSWSIRDIAVVIDAACKASAVSLRFREIFEHEAARTVEIAGWLLTVGLTHQEQRPKVKAEAENALGLESETTSDAAQ